MISRSSAIGNASEIDCQLHEKTTFPKENKWNREAIGGSGLSNSLQLAIRFTKECA